MTWLLRAAVLAATLYAFICVLVWRYQDRFAFPSPRARVPEPPPSHPGALRVAVAAADGVPLKGWYLPPVPAPTAGTTAPGLIWFYGNMETVSAIGGIALDHLPPGTGLLLLDYRGYGENESSLTEELLYRDAETAWSYFATHPGIDSSRISVYGRSLGSVAALHLATSRPVRRVVLDSPFSSVREMAAIHYSFFPRFLVRLSMDNLERARRLEIPLLVFHGTTDWIAPFHMGRRIAEAGRGEFVALEGSGHNETYDVGGEMYRSRLREFLEGR